MNDLETRIEQIKKIFTVNRVRILLELEQEEKCVCELVKSMDISNNLLSHHLSVLSQEGLLDSYKNGRHIKYKVSQDRKKCIGEMLEILELKACD